MSADQVLLGMSLILVLAVGSQVVASRLRIPALIVLLPVGFTAGALTTDVDPQRLLGAAYQPLVSLSVAVILYDSALALDWGSVRGPARRVVPRLVLWGVPLTLIIAAVSAYQLLHMSVGAAVMTGAILVVSGPTVVGPLLRFVQPTERLQRILAWEGSLIDPIGAILAVVVFHAVLSSTGGGLGHPAAQFLLSMGVGGAGAAVGVGVLWLCMCKLRLDEVLSAASQLACVVGVAAGCDIIREDSGLVAALLLGLAVGNLPAFDIQARRPFFDTMVQLIIGVLFVSISATITPASVAHVLLPALALVVVLVLVARPLAAMLATLGTDLTRGERTFTGWMAPRGIVAAATASTFGATLAAEHVAGASGILPVTFVVIVATVAIYGLTAVPVARRLGVTRAARSRPLLIGGEPWVIDLASHLHAAGLDILMWAPADGQRSRISQAGLEVAEGELLVSAVTEGSDIEGITSVLLLTDEDHFNALAATTISGYSDELPVYRLAPASEDASTYIPGETLFGPSLTRPELTARYRAGARITTRPCDGPVPPSDELLFLINAEGSLIPTTATRPPAGRTGDTLVLLSAPT